MEVQEFIGKYFVNEKLTGPHGLAEIIRIRRGLSLLKILDWLIEFTIEADYITLIYSVVRRFRADEYDDYR